MSLQARMLEALKRLLPEDEMAQEYDHTWKEWEVPQGEPIPSLRARAKKVPVTVGWPTPDTGRDEALATWQARLERMRERHPDKGGMGSTGPLHIAAQLAGWPTPMAGSPATEDYNAAGNTDSSRRTEAVLVGWGTPRVTTNGGNGSLDRSTDGKARLEDQVQGAILAGWPTCKSSDADKGIRTAEGAEAEFERKGTGADLPTPASAVSPEATTPLVPLGGWGTPTSQDSRHASFSASQQQRDPNVLSNQAFVADLSGWGTPRGVDAKDGACMDANTPTNGYLSRQAVRLPGEGFGATVSPSSAGTGKPVASRGSLNPAFSLWLMSYPMAWMACGMLASIAFRSRPKKSKAASRSSRGRATRS